MSTPRESVNQAKSVSTDSLDICIVRLQSSLCSVNRAYLMNRVTSQVAISIANMASFPLGTSSSGSVPIQCNEGNDKVLLPAANSPAQEDVRENK